MVEKSEGPEAGGHCPESHKKIAANGRIFVIAQPRNQRQRRTESSVSTLSGVSAFPFATISNLCVSWAVLPHPTATPHLPNISAIGMGFSSQACNWVNGAPRSLFMSVRPDRDLVAKRRRFSDQTPGVGAPKLALGGFLDPAYQKYGFISSAGHWAQ